MNKVVAVLAGLLLTAVAYAGDDPLQFKGVQMGVTPDGVAKEAIFGQAKVSEGSTGMTCAGEPQLTVCVLYKGYVSYGAAVLKHIQTHFQNGKIVQLQAEVGVNMFDALEDDMKKKFRARAQCSENEDEEDLEDFEPLMCTWDDGKTIARLIRYEGGTDASVEFVSKAYASAKSREGEREQKARIMGM
jgi:hypothetical protein